MLRQNLPDQLSELRSWKVVSESRSQADTFGPTTSSQTKARFSGVIPTLKKQIQPSGVYLGVGPEQNFTYLTALAPKLALSWTIRRQNMLLHLMYKAIFELSANRTEFLSKLFARPIPDDLESDATTEQLFEVFSETDSDPDAGRENLEQYSPSCATVTIST